MTRKTKDVGELSSSNLLSTRKSKPTVACLLEKKIKRREGDEDEVVSKKGAVARWDDP